MQDTEAMGDGLVAKLNEIRASAGLEDGQAWVADGEGQELGKVGDFSVARTNSGPRVDLVDGQLVVEFLGSTGSFFLCFDERTGVWAGVAA